MNSNILKFLYQGIWASLSGGWYYDSNHSSFTNIFHLYTWLLLLCVPFVLYVVTSLTWAVIGSYFAGIFLFFFLLKVFNNHLHHTFDFEDSLIQNHSNKADEVTATDPQVDVCANLLQPSEELQSEELQVDDKKLKSCHTEDDPYCGDSGHRNMWNDLISHEYDDAIQQSLSNKQSSILKKESFHNELPCTSKMVKTNAQVLKKSKRFKNKRSMGTCILTMDSSSDTEFWTESDDERNSLHSSSSWSTCASSKMDDLPTTSRVVPRMHRRVGFRKRPRRMKASTVALRKTCRKSCIASRDHYHQTRVKSENGESQDKAVEKNDTNDRDEMFSKCDASNSLTSLSSTNTGTLPNTSVFNPLIIDGVSCSENTTKRKASTPSDTEISKANGNVELKLQNISKHHQKLSRQDLKSQLHHEHGECHRIDVGTLSYSAQQDPHFSLDSSTHFKKEVSGSLSVGNRHRHPAGDQPIDSFSNVVKSDDREAVATSNKEEEIPSACIYEHDTWLESSQGAQLHMAKAHNDTSEGAVHSFQDEFGKWMTYTFANEGLGVAMSVSQQESALRLLSSSTARQKSHKSSSSLSILDSINGNAGTSSQVATLPQMSALTGPITRLASSARFPEHQLLMDALRRTIDTGQRMPSFPGADTSPSSIISQLEVGRRASSPKVKLTYNLKILPFKSITIQYDRLALLDLLDRNMILAETICSVLLAGIVGIIGLFLLSLHIFHDLESFWFCVVMATSQFSLIKSVQPDSASPTHGHNRVIAYSRPFYFIISSSLLLLLNFLSDENNVQLAGIKIYGFQIFTNEGCAAGRDFMHMFTLLLPVFFLFGLLPQISTCLLYLCEQIEIHIFGGVASTSTIASIFSVARSFFIAAILFGFCYGAMITKEKSQHILFSAFCGLLISFTYHLSRQSSSPWTLWLLLKSKILPLHERNVSWNANESGDDPAKEADSISSKYTCETLNDRLQSDIILCPFISVFIFAVHCSTAFSSLQNALSVVLYVLVIVVGVILHYILPHLRKNLPWLLFARPILKSREYDLFEVTETAKLMWFERAYVLLGFFEKIVLFPIFVMNELTKEAPIVTKMYGEIFGCIVITVIGLKLIRSAFSIPSSQYLIYAFSILFVHYDAQLYEDSVLTAYFLFGILFIKFQELVLKLNFWLVYVAPWQITWGSAFHAFAQPFAVPHSAFFVANALLASLIQAPFTPLLGSALFLSSYARPLKFWEKNYNTKRKDHSNTPLSSQFERGPHSDDNNLNSIFYEHLTYSLQRSLAGDLALGKWGNVYPGDCFILASDHLNALVHIVELGNGMVTFQLRGLEFSGTYCQQREVEAINEPPDSNKSFCCCKVGKIKGMLSFNGAFNQRWLAWQVIASNYVLDGYSITDNNATTMLGVFDLRKILINYIVKSIVFFLISHDSLDTWIDDPDLRKQLAHCEQADYADTDTKFSITIDDDYDTWLSGISRRKFYQVYGSWIDYCCMQRAKVHKEVDHDEESKLVTLCYAIAILGRRALGTASHNLSSNLDSFMYGLHALFKGDFRITSSKDEWVFGDINLLRQVVAPGVRMALKLHQDHFTSPEEYDLPETLYESIANYNETMVITHEGDPVWRNAVLSNVQSLLALRRVISETFVDQYSVVTLNQRPLGFTVVRVNRECVRGLWAGQQNELIFLRIRNPERGSIQNAKQVLRNMINSSCDQPIGYPIYVSPLTSSFASTNISLKKIIKGPLTFKSVRAIFVNFINCLRRSCTGSCDSGGSGAPPHSIPLQTFHTPHVQSHRVSCQMQGNQTVQSQQHRMGVAPTPSSLNTGELESRNVTTSLTSSGNQEELTFTQQTRSESSGSGQDAFLKEFDSSLSFTRRPFSFQKSSTSSQRKSDVMLKDLKTAKQSNEALNSNVSNNSNFALHSKAE